MNEYTPGELPDPRNADIQVLGRRQSPASP